MRAGVQGYTKCRVSIERLQELAYEPRGPGPDCRRDDIEPMRRIPFVTDSGSITRILAYLG